MKLVPNQIINRVENVELDLCEIVAFAVTKITIAEILTTLFCEFLRRCWLILIVYLADTTTKFFFAIPLFAWFHVVGA